MFSSVAIIEAQTTSVEAKRSRRCPSSSRTFALFISLMHALVEKEKAKISLLQMGDFDGWISVTLFGS
jgi:hypothetical protein